MAQKIVKPATAQRFAKDYIGYLKNDLHLSIKKAFLFGSYAKRTSRLWSDIDVCVISDKFKRVDPLVYLWTRRRDIDVERGIEPVGFAPEDFIDESPLAWEIKKTGIRVR